MPPRALPPPQVGGGLQLLAFRQKGKSNFELAASLRIPLTSPAVPALPLRRLACLRWSNDGRQMALALAERPTQLLLLNTHGLQVSTTEPLTASPAC